MPDATPLLSGRDRLLLGSAVGLLHTVQGREDASEAVHGLINLAVAVLGDMVGLSQPSGVLRPVGDILQATADLLEQVSPELGDDDPVFTAREAVNEAISCWEFEGPYGGDSDDLREWRDLPDEEWSELADEHGVTVWELHWFSEQSGFGLGELRRSPPEFIDWVCDYRCERSTFLQLVGNTAWRDH